MHVLRLRPRAVGNRRDGSADLRASPGEIEDVFFDGRFRLQGLKVHTARLDGAGLEDVSDVSTRRLGGFNMLLKLGVRCGNNTPSPAVDRSSDLEGDGGRTVPLMP